MAVTAGDNSKSPSCQVNHLDSLSHYLQEFKLINILHLKLYINIYKLISHFYIMKCERGNNPSTTDTCNPAKDSKINNCKAGKCVCGDGSTGTNGVCLAASTVPECRNSKGTLATRGDQGASNTCKVRSSDTTKS